MTERLSRGFVRATRVVALASGVLVVACGSSDSEDGGQAGPGTPTSGSGGGSGGTGSGTGASGSGGAGGSTECAPGSSFCDGACIDTTGDMANCGACGAVCAAVSPSTATCVASRCVVTLATVPGMAGWLAVDADNVYWTNPIGNSVHKVPIDGGEPVTLVDTPVPGSIAVHASYLYWVSDSNCSCGTVTRSGLDGSTPTDLVLDVGQASSLRVDGTGIYFLSFYSALKAPLAGGMPTALGNASEFVQAMVMDDDAVYFTASNFGGDGQVNSVPKAGGAMTKLAWQRPTAKGIGVTATDVYWIDPSLTRVTIGGGEWIPVSTWTGDWLLVDGSHAYGLTQNGWEKQPLDGGSPVVLVSPGGRSPAVDASSFYWLEEGNGVARVMKVTPK